jgi:drug/metabolite transporter (DMT)-like permease
MQQTLHPNAIRSSNLLRLSAFMVVVDYVIQIKFYGNEPFGFVRFFAIVLLLGVAFALRKRQLWIRWPLLALILMGILGIIVTAFTSIGNKQKAYVWCIETFQDVIQLTAAILLFIPYDVPQAEPYGPELFIEDNTID